jgi:hypothetical protein
MPYRDDSKIVWYKRTAFAPVWVGLALVAVFGAVLVLMFGTQDLAG